MRLTSGFRKSALTMLLLSAAYHLEAAELRIVKPCTEDGCQAMLYVIGQIDNGDASRFRDILKKHGPAVDTVMLRSPGGSMYDSMEIGEMVNSLKLNTSAPYRYHCPSDDAKYGVHHTYCSCDSGCFLIWLGGVNRYGTNVGMHRPWDSSRAMGTKDYDQISGMYRKWLADLKSFFARMEIPGSYFDILVATVNSGEIRSLKDEEISKLIYHPSTDEWLRSRCGHWPNELNLELGRLNMAYYQGEAHSAQRRKILTDRYSSIATCRIDAQQASRVAAFKKLFGP